MMQIINILGFYILVEICISFAHTFYLVYLSEMNIKKDIFHIYLSHFKKSLLAFKSIFKFIKRTDLIIESVEPDQNDNIYLLYHINKNSIISIMRYDYNKNNIETPVMGFGLIGEYLYVGKKKIKEINTPNFIFLLQFLIIKCYLYYIRNKIKKGDYIKFKDNDYEDFADNLSIYLYGYVEKMRRKKKIQNIKQS